MPKERWNLRDTARSSGPWLRGGAVALALALVLAGCSGSGGGGPAASVPGFTIPTAPVLSAAASFETAEFALDPALGQVNAQYAYARGGTGRGVTVAVIDTGVDPTNPDLVGNLSSQPINIVSPSQPISDDDGHGTWVSGVIAAEKNNSGTHGIAYEATLLPIRAEATCTSSPCGFTDTAVANGIDFAIASGAKVINLSLGGASPSNVLHSALIRAAQAGVIVAAAAGNDAGTSPLYPAAYAGDPGMLGLVLAVAAVDGSNVIASFSNGCGNTPTQSYCLSAPGVDVVTTDVGGGLVVVSGTSFSAPLVSGAAAILLQLFPTLSPAQIVQIILQTAAALGDPKIYGQGLLDLQNAVTPQGILTVPLSTTAAGPSVPLSLSSVSLGPAFGDALAHAPALSQAIFVDALGRPYPVDLGAYVAQPRRSPAIAQAIAPDRRRSVSMPTPEGMSVKIGFAEQDPVQADLAGPWQAASGAERFTDADLGMTFGLGGTRTFSFAVDAMPTRLFDGAGGGPAPAGLFWASEEMFAPQSGILAPGEGVGLSQGLGGGRSLRLGYFETGGAEQGRLSRRPASLWSTRFDQALPGGGRVGLGFGTVEEQGALLSSDFSGAFGAVGGTTRFATADATIPLGGGLDAFAGLTYGWTRVAEGGPALLGDWGTIRSSAFGAGLAAREVAAPGDRLGFLVGQPLRVEAAEAMLTVPTALNADGTVTQRKSRTDVAPSGRELDFQLAYDRAVGGGADLSTWMMMRIEPGHVAGAAPDFGIGFRLGLKL